MHEDALVNEIATWCAPLIRADLEPEMVADYLVEHGHDNGAGDFYVEIPARYSRSGNPVIGGFAAPLYQD